MHIKVGLGYDVHRLETGYKLMIGGIEIPFDKGSVGHSDGDVLIHAIMDALLGAAGLRDIGFHFPDHEPKLKGIDSKILLSQTLTLLQEKDYTIGNIDATVCLQTPKIASYIPQMQETLAGILKTEHISIKATTTEKLGFVGQGEGIAAQAVALIFKTNTSSYD